MALSRADPPAFNSAPRHPASRHLPQPGETVAEGSELVPGDRPVEATVPATGGLGSSTDQLEEMKAQLQDVIKVIQNSQASGVITLGLDGSLACPLSRF